MEHASYAKSMQVQYAITPRNGSLIRLAPGEPEILDEVPSGRLFLDGARLVPEAAEGLIERRRLSVSGIILATLCIDEAGDVIDGPVIAVKGLSESDGRIADESLEPLDTAAAKAFEGIKRRERMDDEVVEKVVGRALRKACEVEFGVRPLIEVIVLRS
jgi:ribonuclease J